MNLKRSKSLAFAVILAVSSIIGIGITGCGSTPATKMAQTVKPIITLVNDGVAEMVAAINAGKMTQAQIDGFHEKYNIYYASIQALKAVNLRLAVSETDPTITVSQADRDAAKAAVTDAEQALLDLLNSYLR